MRELDYQTRVLDTLNTYLDALSEHKVNADAVSKLVLDNPILKIDVPDYTKDAWEELKQAGKLPASRSEYPFSPRADGCGRPVPNITLKVPTGGGKTFLATNAVSRVLGRYLGVDTGFVLWIVPNDAIYQQTLRSLKNRHHPYRQTLDRAAAGRVKIYEKADRLDARDVETHLCVMVLMLQSANRQTQDALRMFKDRGDVQGFTPHEGEQLAHEALFDAIPNLATYDLADGTVGWRMVKDSLGNALRIIRPIVIMDEGQKAISDLAYKTLYDFNPSIVIELSATPKDVAARGGANPRPARFVNVLVEVTGREVDREGMLKMPLNLETKAGTDWKLTLNAALDRLNDLDGQAKAYHAQSGRYIRPIMLVQVQRTGKDQRDGGYIHSEDVKDWLLTAGFDEAEVAIKTADTNDLKQPENLDLLSSTNRVRVIITKAALQEGWDCPFAYVLCSLAASSNLSAMTQLVGRILRQPHALKTGVDALDECYIIAHHASTADVVAAIKQGLENDGLGDLVLKVIGTDANAAIREKRKVLRRDGFRQTDIYLPKVLWVDGGELRDLDYETDVQSRIDWRDYDPAPVANTIPENGRAAESQLQRILLSADVGEPIVNEKLASYSTQAGFDPAYAVRIVSDLIPNPFVARAVIERYLAVLKSRGFDDAKIASLASMIIEELRKGLDKERAKRAEALFKQDVTDGCIQFRLRLDGRNWIMPKEMETTEPDNAPQIFDSDGLALKKSLFAPVYQAELNGEEKDVAVYLDGHKAVTWWHRNVARAHYALQGWKRSKIYPDFIFAATGKGAERRITILETKGDQLEGNLDTTYKRNVLDLLSESFTLDKNAVAGELEIFLEDGVSVDCAMILMSEQDVKLPIYLD